MQPQPKNLQEAILATLCYFDIFEYPLTHHELWRFLYWPGATPTSLMSIIQETTTLVSEKKVEMHNGFFFLPGKSSHVDSRADRFARSIPQWRRAQKLFSFLSQVPFLRATALCNQFSLANAKATSDIDVFIITETHRIWSVRFLVWFFTMLKREWRHGARIAGRFCLSFFLTRDAQNLQFMAKQPYDIYLTYWIATLAFVQGKGNEFFAANRWIHVQLPNFLPREEIPLHRAHAPIFQKSAQMEEKIWKGALGNIREKVVRSIQRKKMEKNHASKDVSISDTILKFHENDRRELFRQEFEKRFFASTKKL